jgi:hypothetical protein
MRRVLKALVSDKPIDGLTALEDKGSVGGIKRAYEEFKRIMMQ